jgi:hypothetical protein
MRVPHSLTMKMKMKFGTYSFETVQDYTHVGTILTNKN